MNRLQIEEIFPTPIVIEQLPKKFSSLTNRKYSSFFSLLTKYTLIAGLLFHFSAIDFNPNLSENTIEILDDTNGGEKKDVEEKELFFADEIVDSHSASTDLEYILLQLEMKPSPHFCEIPSPPPDLF